MRKLLCIAYITILLFFKPGYAQSDSVLSYMPLNIGNQWQYRVHYVVNNSNIDTTYYSLYTVKYDTIVHNGFQYQVIESDFETKYVRLDSATACVYEYEFDSTQGFKTDSLRCSEGDFFGRNNYCELIDTASILNYRTWVMVIDRTMPDISEKHSLAMDIGISFKEVITTFGFGTQKTSTIVYANINGTEFGEMVTSVEDENISPSAFSLSQNYPNPFNLSTEIHYQLLKQSFISLKVYDVLGNEVANLVNEEKPSGKYEVEFNGEGLTSGIYFYQIKTGDPESSSGQGFIETKKMVLMK